VSQSVTPWRDARAQQSGVIGQHNDDCPAPTSRWLVVVLLVAAGLGALWFFRSTISAPARDARDRAAKAAQAKGPRAVDLNLIPRNAVAVLSVQPGDGVPNVSAPLAQMVREGMSLDDIERVVEVVLPPESTFLEDPRAVTAPRWVFVTTRAPYAFGKGIDLLRMNRSKAAYVNDADFQVEYYVASEPDKPGQPQPLALAIINEHLSVLADEPLLRRLFMGEGQKATSGALSGPLHEIDRGRPLVLGLNLAEHLPWQPGARLLPELKDAVHITALAERTGDKMELILSVVVDDPGQMTKLGAPPKFSGKAKKLAAALNARLKQEAQQRQKDRDVLTAKGQQRLEGSAMAVARSFASSVGAQAFPQGLLAFVPAPLDLTDAVEERRLAQQLDRMDAFDKAIRITAKDDVLSIRLPLDPATADLAARYYEPLVQLFQARAVVPRLGPSDQPSKDPPQKKGPPPKKGKGPKKVASPE
jgi:hypothetical protein